MSVELEIRKSLLRRIDVLESEYKDLEAKYKKALIALKVYAEIDRLNGYEGAEYPANPTLAELGEKE